MNAAEVQKQIDAAFEARVENAARAIIRSHGPATSHLVADAHWSAEMRSYRQQEHIWGEKFTSSRSLVNDAMRYARTVLQQVEAERTSQPTEAMLDAGMEIINDAERRGNGWLLADVWEAMEAARLTAGECRADVAKSA